MSNQKKTRVVVLYGGRSGEHEVSLRSAASVIQNLNPSRYEVIPVAIDKQGRWLLNDVQLILQSKESLPVYRDAPIVALPPHPGVTTTGLLRFGGSSAPQAPVDVVFPVIHGPLCEDGTIQGLLELADVPFVGCGVLASAVAMDKDCAKRLVREGGVPIVPFITLKPEVWRKEALFLSQRINDELGFPVFVKPANLGSSVGVHKVNQRKDLDAALQDAFRYDTKVLVEKAIRGREIELALLENSESGLPPHVSVPGEVIPSHEFYSYEAKYLDEKGAKLLIPAPLEPSQIKEAQKIAATAFELLGCEGMARIDLFLDQETGKFYFNEANTIPGFTSISMYPKMWEHSGIPYSQLLSRLIDLAILRHERKKSLVRDYSTQAES